jgi:hypothetical protein
MHTHIHTHTHTHTPQLDLTGYEEGSEEPQGVSTSSPKKCSKANSESENSNSKNGAHNTNDSDSSATPKSHADTQEGHAHATSASEACGNGRQMDEDLSRVIRDKEGRVIYKLHSVLVHYGDIHGGHYYSYVRPDCESDWFKFNDDRVSKASAAEAINANFGYSQEENQFLPAMRRQESLQKRLSNAYMLVYVRASYIPELLAPLREQDIPVHLRERFEREDYDVKQAPFKMRVCLVTDQTLAKHHDADFVTFEQGTYLSVLKQDTVSKLKDIIFETTGCPVKRQRLWTFSKRDNQTERIESPLGPEQDDISILKCVRYAKEKNPVLKVYMQELSIAESSCDGSVGGCQYDADKEVLVSLKFFNPRKQELKYLGSMIMPNDTLIGDIVGVVEMRLKKRRLLVYEEVTPNRIEEPQPDQTLEKANIGTVCMHACMVVVHIGTVCMRVCMVVVHIGTACMRVCMSGYCVHACVYACMCWSKTP